jgi:hypothetical protein
MFIFLKINKMTANIRKNLFRLEKEEYDIIEQEEEPIIKNQKSKKKIKLYPIKENKKLSSKIKTFEKPGKGKKYDFLEASKYPGEIVEHQSHYYISLREGDDFSWFLLK